MLPLLAASPPSPPPLECTIGKVTSRWTPKPIQSVRVLDGMQFTVLPGPPLKIEPRFVIDSRLTLLAKEQSPPVVTRQSNGELLYSWAFEAPLGMVATDANDPGSARPALAQVEGRLTLRADRGFTLLNLTQIKAESGAATLTQLQESATGTCREQR
jgi:hypothetical protein